jgi:predicted LPLAT superfamily acyltransferase
MLDAEHEKIKEYLSEFTQRSFNIIPVKDDNSHVYLISEALRNHEIVCMHGDRFLPGSKTLTASLLGGEALLPTGPFYLAMKYGVPVSFVFAMKELKTHYHFFATAPAYYSQQSTLSARDAMLRNILNDYLKEVEEKIRHYPYQWFNYYEFWKS